MLIKFIIEIYVNNVVSRDFLKILFSIGHFPSIRHFLIPQFHGGFSWSETLRDNSTSLGAKLYATARRRLERNFTRLLDVAWSETLRDYSTPHESIF